MWDHAIGLPIPPIAAVAPAQISHGATILFTLIAAVAFIYGLKHWRDTGRPILLLILLGGGMTSLVEPLVDLLGACWHPVFGQATVFKLMGRPIPWWIVAVYFAFFGSQGSLLYVLIRRGVTMNAIRLLFLMPVAADIVIEQFALPTGLYIYNGHQPLILVGMLPLWWAACNSIGLLVGIFLVIALQPLLRGYKSLFILLILPLGDVLGYAAIGVPSFIAINTENMPDWAVQAAGVATLLLCYALVQGIAAMLGRDSPLRQARASASGSPVDIGAILALHEQSLRPASILDAH